MTPLPENPSRRSFLQAAGIVTARGALGRASPSAAGPSGPEDRPKVVLPKGEAPKPVEFPHFPDRLHAFVWRNWPLVPLERMARVVGARTEDLRRIGRAMGLADPPRISRDQQRRSTITVIKRNWHLLPYGQLLELLGWTPEELAYTLREDDFLFVKLGRLKPECEPLKYQPTEGRTLDREREIGSIVRGAFPDDSNIAADPPFSFVARLSELPPASAARQPGTDSLRFCYSYFALYGDPLLDTDADPYPDGFLARLAQAGVNGVWLQAVLYKLAPFPWEPGRSTGREERLKNLRSLVDRAHRHGIRVFLYLNEPRAMPLDFFEARPHLKGVVERDYAALCTSDREVQKFLVDSVAAICRAVPEVGGFFTITASENLSNCWSHGDGAKCPRCGARQAAEVIAEVNGLFAEGIRKSGARAQLLAWDWGWSDAWAGDAIRRLPAEAALMSVSEWSLPIERGGVKSQVGEYSISAIGPGPRARRHWELARQRGLKTIAKIQAGNTWELSTVPWIPAVEYVARHAAYLRVMKVDGLLLGWTLGGYPSPNLEVVSEAMACGSADEAMRRVAERRFGKTLAPAVVLAWRGISEAFREFPYDGGVVYSAPQQLGPANLLWEEPTGYRATMTGFPYDDLDRWRAIYQPEAFISQMEKVSGGIERALNELKATAAGQGKALTKSEGQALDEELAVAEAVAIHFQSSANQARFVMARNTLLTAKTSAEAGPHIDTLERILNQEISLACRLRAIQWRDARIGFEASNQYFYLPVDLAEKIVNCRDLLDRWLPAMRRRFGG